MYNITDTRDSKCQYKDVEYNNGESIDAIYPSDIMCGGPKCGHGKLEATGSLQKKCKYSKKMISLLVTVKPRFSNIIRSRRLFEKRFVRNPKLIISVLYLVP